MLRCVHAHAAAALAVRREQLLKLGLREVLAKLQVVSGGDSTLLRYIARAQAKLGGSSGTQAP